VLRSAHPSAPMDPFRAKAPTVYSFLSAGADIRDAGAADLGRMRAECDGSLFAFAWLIMGNQWFTLDYHWPICEFIAKWGTPGWKRLGVCVPRDIGKTTLATRANSLWQVCRAPGHLATVAIFNAKEDNSKKWLRAIRSTVESNPIFHVLYKDMLPPGIALGDPRPLPKRWKWNDEELEFVRDFPAPPEASITALGIGGASTGGHWTHIIKDDIIGLEESRSEAAMNAAIEWSDSAYDLESPARKGNDLWVYTTWHHADVYRHRDEKFGDQYKIFRRPAMQLSALGEEESSFPEKWTTAELQDIATRDPYLFASQYALKPKAGRSQSFDHLWPRDCTVTLASRGPVAEITESHYDSKRHKLLEEPDTEAPRHYYTLAMEKALLWDPAPSEGELTASATLRSRNGMCLVGRDAWMRDFVLQGEGTLLDPLETIRRAIRMCQAWNCSKVVVEEVNFAKLYKHFVDYVLRAEFPGYQITFWPIPYPKGQKDMRIQGLIPDFKAGHIYFNTSLTHQVRREMKDYQPGMKKGIDCLDALAMKDIPGVLPRPLTTQEMFRQQIAAERRGGRQRGRTKAYDRTHYA
jgi:hypothetical protein